MEFTSFLNRVLACHEAGPDPPPVHPHLRRCSPSLRTVGWWSGVPHTRGLRQILQDLYSAAGKLDKMTLGVPRRCTMPALPRACPRGSCCATTSCPSSRPSFTGETHLSSLM